MRLNFSIPLFLFILLLSLFTITGNFQNSFALTPVADLTGDWSGFAQVTNYPEASCEFTGKVNAHLTQHENDIEGQFSFVATNAKPTQTEYECVVWSIEQDIHGTIDGSRITLYTQGATFSGWYASAGIRLDINADDFKGTAQLSPTNFTPPEFEPKNEPVPPPECRADQELVNNQCQCPAGEEEINGVCQTALPATGEEAAQGADSAELDKSLADMKNEPQSKDWAENGEIFPDNMQLTDIKDKVLELNSQARFDEALLLLDKILENDPENIFALYNKGAILGNLDRNIEALSYIDKVLSIDPNDSDAQQAQKDILDKIKIGSRISVKNETPIAEAKSYFTAGGERGKICNEILNKKNPCTRELSGELKPGDQIITGENNFAVIKLDGGKSTIYLGPNSYLGVLQINEKLRLFYLPFTNTLMKAEIHDEPGVTTKFGMCEGEIETCNIEKLRFWAWIHGTELIIERHPGEDTKMTVLQGHVGVLKGDEQTPTVTIDTNNQLVFKNGISLDTKIRSINPESIDRWWDKALALEQAQQSSSSQAASEKKGGGCLIATAAFGSELAPQIQQLRETRDDVLFHTTSGTAFMNAFNQFYYTFSPTVADWERENPVFKEMVKTTITPMITTLSILNHIPIHSEAEILVYGIVVIFLNIGMYFAIPAFAIIRLKRLIVKCHKNS